MRVAYLDCIGGISGDMTLAALVDAGAPVPELVEGLRTLGLPDWKLETERVARSGISAVHARVLAGRQAADDAPLLDLPPAAATRPLPDAPGDVGTGHSHGHAAQTEQAHAHGGEGGHTHSPDGPAGRLPVDDGRVGHTHAHAGEAGHTHSHGVGTVEPALDAVAGVGPGITTFAAVAACIRGSALPEPVREQAVAVFHRLAAAEARVHGVSLEAVHFHEVGAVDSIVDVVGAVFALHLLGVERVLCSPLPNGHGFVQCAHGRMPIPPPATAELVRGVPLRAVDVAAELVTPTGAALATGLADQFGPLPGFTVQAIGYGAGRKEFPFPNLLRVLIGDAEGPAPTEARTVTLIEANIDDQSPEFYEAAFAALFGAGALDVWLAPILMKKGRPAQTLSVLCRPEQREALTGVIFQQTTTLGVRFGNWERSCLERHWLETDTRYGTIRVKVGRERGELRTVAPEYEDCRRCAENGDVPLKVVHAEAMARAWGLLTGRE
ncbi:MAG: nickel pincer cofactor biosynthesis protein LarC [Armatimonadetes bacterium]|nr:nickel pincer cofactor biosynthesis protein LarC [Armatimonadota bacterium]